MSGWVGRMLGLGRSRGVQKPELKWNVPVCECLQQLKVPSTIIPSGSPELQPQGALGDLRSAWCGSFK